jgi:hypothetical protein
MDYGSGIDLTFIRAAKANRNVAAHPQAAGDGGLGYGFKARKAFVDAASGIAL